MKKKMSNKTDDGLSFGNDRKESIQDRIRQLVGERSLRKVTEAWGLPYSTINNYFEKGTTPGLNVVAKIARIENVSLEWLVYGEINSHPIHNTCSAIPASSAPTTESGTVAGTDIISEMLRRAEPCDRERLINTLCSIGVKGVLQQLQVQPEDTEEAIRALPIRESLKDAVCMALAGNEETDREILRGIERRARSRAAESGHTAEPETLTVKKTA
ncbi:helix-turn-helix domain-containing protein [Edwardsiella hoshinae]|nr:helix-turn-helix transcriptional regulator [Edwardsiella hoshinae]